MNFIDNMLELLKASGIYSFSDNSIVLAEMRAYANVLNDIYEKSTTMIEEGYYHVLLGAYHDKFENMYGFVVTRRDAEDSSQTASQKISLIKQREQITNNDFTVEGIVKCLNSTGVPYEYTEDVENKTISLYLSGNISKYYANLTDAITAVSKFMPYHSKPIIDLE